MKIPPVFLLVCAALLGGCAQYQPVDVFVIGLTPLEGGTLEQRIKVDLRIQNPNEQPITATGMQIRLDVNGARLARGVSDTAFTVPRLGETTTSVVASTTLFDLAKQIVALSGGRQTFQYVLEGSVHVAASNPFSRSVSFRSTGEYPPPKTLPSVNQSNPRALQ